MVDGLVGVVEWLMEKLGFWIGEVGRFICPGVSLSKAMLSFRRHRSLRVYQSSFCDKFSWLARMIIFREI